MGASSGGVRVRRASRKRTSVVTGPAGLPGRRLVGRGGFGWPRSRCGDLGGSQGKRLALECGNVLSLRQVLVQGPKDQFELELTTRQDLGRSHFLRLALATTSIRKPKKNTGIVLLGSTVTLRVAEAERTYRIVGPSESNPSQGRISHVSPLGAALMGHKIGDEIDLTTEHGVTRYTILDIT